LLESYLKDDDAQILLDSAIQWNSAEFEKFSNRFKDENLLEKYSALVKDIQERTKEENWWWIAYEEAYLAVIRKEQGNIVEAFFHAFRAFEGIFAAWGRHQFGEYVEFIKGIPYLSPLVLCDPKDYFSKSRCKKSSDLDKLRVKIEGESVELNLATLCKLFRSSRSEYKQECGDLKIFWDHDKQKNVSEKRNFIVHQVQGMSEKDLWEFWEVSTPKEWEDRLLKFLNFIAKPDLPKEFESFESLEEASLMAKVHEKLESAIAQL